MSMQKNKKIIVFSGINIFEGGPLSIYYDCLDAIKASELWKTNTIIAFVYKKELFENYKKIISLIELPKSREHYLNRLYYEYIYFYKFSSNFHVDIWISLHDITPRVKADRIYTYCHNPSPFAKKNIIKTWHNWKMSVFCYFYKYLYRINIKAATAVIVQQDWMRQKFLKMYPVKKVIVARPNILEKRMFSNQNSRNRTAIFIYAAYPRCFKNFEVILKACKLLENTGIMDFEVWITVDGTENRYSSELKKKYGGLHTVRWCGLLSRKDLFHKYEEADCLIFPSMLETWGLPISEFKRTGKPMILADLPYAHETLGEYDKAVFFNPENEEELGRKIADMLKGNITYSKHENKSIVQPYAEGWSDLLKMIIS